MPINTSAGIVVCLLLACFGADLGFESPSDPMAALADGRSAARRERPAVSAGIAEACPLAVVVLEDTNLNGALGPNDLPLSDFCVVATQIDNGISEFAVTQPTGTTQINLEVGFDYWVEVDLTGGTCGSAHQTTAGWEPTTPNSQLVTAPDARFCDPPNVVFGFAASLDVPILQLMAEVDRLWGDDAINAGQHNSLIKQLTGIKDKFDRGLRPA